MCRYILRISTYIYNVSKTSTQRSKIQGILMTHHAASQNPPTTTGCAFQVCVSPVRRKSVCVSFLSENETQNIKTPHFRTSERLKTRFPMLGMSIAHAVHMRRVATKTGIAVGFNPRTPVPNTRFSSRSDGSGPWGFQYHQPQKEVETSRSLHRRYARGTPFHPLTRGLKPTATPGPSLRDEFRPSLIARHPSFSPFNPSI